MSVCQPIEGDADANCDGNVSLAEAWAAATPANYESGPIRAGWPWCEPNTYPSSYKWEAPCGPDPCTPSGVTLWNFMPCEPVSYGDDFIGEEVVASTGVAPAPSGMLPSTGPVAIGGGLAIAVVLTLTGLWCRRIARRDQLCHTP